MSVSPSQVSEASSGCIRVVAWNIADPQPFEQSEAAVLGDKVHKKLEMYNRYGTNPLDTPGVDGELAALALPFAPIPRRGRSEMHVRWTPRRAPDVTFSMRKDWTGSTSDLNGIAGVDLMPANIDYKTTKDPSYGITSTEKFYQDPQSLIYAEHLMEKTEADRVYNRWLYIRTPSPKKPKPAAIPKDQVMEQSRTHEAMDRLVYPLARKIEGMKSEGRSLKVLDLPFNARNCMSRKYGPGGCPRQAQCNLSAADILVAQAGEDRYMDDLLDLLRKEQGTTAATPAVVAAAPAAAVTVNPAPRLPVVPAIDVLDALLGSGSVAVDTVKAQPMTVAAKVATVTEMFPGTLESGVAIALKEGLPVSDAIIRPSDMSEFMRREGAVTDEEIGRVVRFLLGR